MIRYKDTQEAHNETIVRMCHQEECEEAEELIVPNNIRRFLFHDVKSQIDISLISNLNQLHFQLSQLKIDDISDIVLFLYFIKIDLNALEDVLLTQSSSRENNKLRKRRSPTEEGCSLHQWYVQFSDIGLDFAVVQPSGFMANYCSGSCDATMVNNGERNGINGTNHAYLRSRYRAHYPKARAILPPVQCVTSVLDPVSVIIRGTSSTTLVAKNFAHMAANQCSCF